jgi:acetyl-CoA synthetase
MSDRRKKAPPTDTGGIDAVLDENRTFPPPDDFARKAVASDPGIYARADADPEGFWATFAAELEWSRPWERVREGRGPDERWFVGGRINASVNCVDRHVRGARRNRAALIWEGEPGDRATWTYFDLYREVNKFGNVLRGLGVGRGDRVAIYMPMVPEAVVAMLACARIGAIHSVVFGGFSAEALRDRILDAEAKVLITADGAYRRGSLLPLKHDADYALRDTPSIRHVIVVKRGDFPLRFREGRDHWYHRLMQDAPLWCEPADMDANDPLFILYTSGTTGKPKGIVHGTGGYLTGTYATTRWVFDLREDDVFWCTADIGWVTGHSYIVYGPLAAGATVVLYEGAPDWPDRDRFWDIAARYGVSVFYTAPTAICAFAAARNRGRADQPRGLDVVPHHDRRGALSDRRHVVANRNRADPDHAAPGPHADQARIGDTPVPGDPGRRADRRRRDGRRRRRLPRAPARLARADARGVGR